MSVPDDSPKIRRGLALSNLAQLAEVVASIGVLVTLVFLVFEVRHNTETTQATTYERSMEGLNEWRLTIAGDAELARLWTAYVAGDTEQVLAGQFRLNLLVNTLWGVYENAYYSNQRGLLGVSEWSRFERQICAQYARDQLHGAWIRMAGGPIGVRTLLTDEFAEYAESLC